MLSGAGSIKKLLVNFLGVNLLKFQLRESSIVAIVNIFEGLCGVCITFFLSGYASGERIFLCLFCRYALGKL